MTPNKPTTLREDYKKEEWGGWKIVSDMLDDKNEYGIYNTSKCYQELYNFVVAQKEKAVASHSTELVRKIEGGIKGIAVLHRDSVLRSQMNAPEAVKYYPSSAKNALLVPLDEVLEVISIINQEKMK